MTWKKVLNYIIGILFILSLITNGILGYQNYRYRNTPPDKIEIHDSIFVLKDSIHEKIVYKTKFDTIIDVQYIDTIHNDTIRDTIIVSLPVEHKVSEFELKKDSLTIREKIHHHGFKSEVDSVELDYQWNYTFQPKKQRKWGLVWFIGPTVTGGVNFNVNNKTFDYGPSVGLSVGVGLGGVIK